MYKVDWDKVASEEYEALPAEYKADWAEMRAVVYGE
jgi:hypothetical protein